MRKLFKLLDDLKSDYLLNEADEEPPFPTGETEEQDDTEEDNTNDEIDSFQETDPTETPEQSDIPENENGTFISDTKLAMFANLLLRAFLAPSGGNVPSNLQNATAENANEIIAFIESRLNLNKPTNNIVSNLSKIN